jgi:hypothetical protein
MIAMHPLEWHWFSWRFIKSLLAMVVSLLLLAGAAVEAGKRLAPRDPALDGRLVEATSLERSGA